MAIQITIIEHITDNRVIVKCTYCKGTGKEPSYSNRACFVCNGKGVLLLEIDGELPLVICAYCNETGKEPNYSNKPCSQCHGSGAQPIVGRARIVR